jgi:hypothetical protein
VFFTEFSAGRRRIASALRASEERFRTLVEFSLDATHLPFKDFEIAHRTTAGGVRCISASGIPVFDDLGRVVGYRGVDRDTIQ